MTTQWGCPVTPAGDRDGRVHGTVSFGLSGRRGGKRRPDEISDEVDDFSAMLRLLRFYDAKCAFKIEREGRKIDELRPFDLHIQAVNPPVA